uniref:Uncharacterized protein n=1 Tax=Romanomermis culicivorax TaxID=13658 RepID=A0A915J4F3_ROMCU
MLHMEEQKKKNHLSLMALIKDRLNMMAAEYQRAIEKLELKIRLLNCQQQKGNVNFWEYHLECMEQSQLLEPQKFLVKHFGPMV